MSYIGTKPTVGNFQICDAISVVNGQAAYTMQVGSVNVIPQSANHMIVSLNGTIQKPNSSFTVSGSTITFASNLVTGDVIDFIQILGDVLDLGVPSDATVTTAKLADSSVTTAKLNDASVSLAKLTASGTKDATTFLRGDNTFAEAGGGAFEKISTTTISSSVASVDFNTLSTDYRDFRIICSDLRIDTHQQFVLLKVKRAGQSSYDGGSGEYIYAVMGYDSDSNEIKAQSASSGQGDNKLKLIPASLARDATVDGANADILIDCYNVHATDSKFMIRADTTFIEGTYGRSAVGIGGGYRDALDAIIGIQITNEGSTQFISGTVTLYGRKI